MPAAWEADEHMGSIKHDFDLTLPSLGTDSAWCLRDTEGNNLFHVLFIILLLTVLLRRQTFSVSSELQFLNLHFISACFDLKAVCWEALEKPAHPFKNGYLLYISE